MSTKPNLTSKFSRRSLKKANAPSATARVHSKEEELARATNKRFNSDSWRKVSRSYQPFPTVSPGGASHMNVANTQILCALSSLTEDQAFQTGSSDIPIRGAPSFAASSAYSSARESPSFLRTQTPSPRPYNRFHPEKGITASDTGAVTYSTAVVPENESREPSSTDPQREIPSVRDGSTPEVSSLRKTAGHIPRFSRKLRQGRLPKSPLKSRTVEPTKQKTKSATELRRSKEKSSTSFESVFSPFFLLFKAIHYLLLLPHTIVSFLTRRRWSVKGKTVLITGASSGIGAEIARQYAAEGASLALISRTHEALEQVVQDCRGLGSDKALFYGADLSNPVSTKLAMKQAIKDFGKFDVVVLNAGRSQGCYFEEIKDPSQIESMIKLNVNGAITTLHYLLPQIPKTKDSRIVIISNTTGIVAAPYQTVYSATKHALTGFANSLRMELRNTYGPESPRICLVNFPEVAGTKSNNDRMDMGARLPPTKWYSWAGIPLPQAVRTLLPAIAMGRREFGQSRKINMWRSMYAYCPEWADQWMMDYIQRTHYRPLDERKGTNEKSSNASGGESKTPPTNRSW